MNKYLPFLLFISLQTSAQQLSLVLPIGHTDIITTTGISSDNKFILSTGGETLKVWDLASGKEQISIKAHAGNITGAFFLPDGSHILTGGEDSSIKIWNLFSGRLEKKYFCKGGSVTCLEITKDGKTAIVATEDKIIYFFNLETGLTTNKLKKHLQTISSLSVSQDGEQLLSAAYDEPIMWWEIKSGKILRQLQTSSNKNINAAITLVRFLPNQSLVLVGDRDADASLWDLPTGKKLRSFPSVYNLPKSYASIAQVLTGITAVNCFTNNSTVWIAREKTIALYDLKTAKLKKSIIAHDGDVYTASSSEDGRFYITGSNDLTIKLWDASTGRLLNTFQGHTESVSVAIIAPDNIHALCFTNSGSLKYWNLQTGEFLGNLQEHNGSVLNAQFSRDGKLVLSCGLDNTVKLTDILSGKTLLSYFTGKRESYSNLWQPGIRSVCFSTDEKEILVATDNSLLLIDPLKRQLKKAFRFPSDYGSFDISMARYGPSGKEIYYSESSSIQLLDSKTGKSTEKYTTGTNLITLFEFSSNAKYLAAATKDGLVYIWNLDNGQQYQLRQDTPRVMNSIAFSRDGEWLVTSSNDGTCRIWDIGTGDEKKVLRGHNNWVTGASFSHDGKKILSASDDNTCRFWDLTSGKTIASFISIDSVDYITVLADGNYRGTPRAISLLSFRFDNNFYPFEQFDLKWNRPDLVLEALSHPDASLISLYKKAYEKRLLRLGLNDSLLTNDFELPQIQVLSKNKFPPIVQTEIFKIPWTSVGNKYPITQLIVKINGIPERVSLVNNKSKDTKADISDSAIVSLSEGLNKIQLSCLNSNGLESLKETFYIEYKPLLRKTARLWFIGIGVSNFSDSSHNLHYAAKDIRDLSMLCRQADRNCIIDTLIDKKATRQNILALKKLLSTTSIEDRVIISFSGHGLLNETKDFYFATYDQDFNTPSFHNSIGYAEIESLFDDIPARKKLLLIDACNSGEVDKELTTNSISDSNTKGNIVVKKINTRGAVMGKSPEKRTSLYNSFELMKTIFADLTTNNGAFVISAAAGNEYALEDKRWSNGAFTFCVKKALTDKTGTKTQKGITITQLKNYVSREVEILTRGHQRPTTRQGSVEYDWVIW